MTSSVEYCLESQGGVARILVGKIFSEDVLAGNSTLGRWVVARLLDRTFYTTIVLLLLCV